MNQPGPLETLKDALPHSSGLPFQARLSASRTGTGHPYPISLIRLFFCESAGLVPVLGLTGTTAANAVAPAQIGEHLELGEIDVNASFILEGGCGWHGEREDWAQEFLPKQQLRWCKYSPRMARVFRIPCLMSSLPKRCKPLSSLAPE